MNREMQYNEWAAWGERLSSELDGVHATVVAAHDANIAAHVALSIARSQGIRRRVAIADLVGELPPLQSLIDGDDPHGISDSFLYGVSLNKIARAVGDTGSVFLMPSGTESVANQAVYSNERWRKLAAGFHQVGALLLVVAKPDTAGFADLCGYIGTVLPVGDYNAPYPAGVPVISPSDSVATDTSSSSSAAQDSATDSNEESRSRERRAREAAGQDGATRQRKFVVLTLILFAVAIALGTMWPRIAPMLPARIASLLGSTAADSTSEPLVRVPAAIDSSVKDSLSASNSADVVIPGTGEIPPVINPEDSTRAARFAIYFTSANTREAAMPDDRIRALPSVALTPVDDAAEVWYRLTIGAYTDRSEADALLRRMRDEKLIGSGSIVRVPYAIRLEKDISIDVAQARTASFVRRGIIAYALRQSDGSATIFTGAFETPHQAIRLADSLRSTGITPVLVHRTGRAF